MYKLAVVGNPIAHSLSPVIFAEFAKQTGVNLVYDKICAPIDDFEHVVKQFFADDGFALNITAPFKARAFAMADKHQPHTILPGTANVLINTQTGLVADNTDGLGLVADFEHKHISLKGKKILIIGSGSVIFSVLPSLEEASPERIDLLMRNWDKLNEFIMKSRLVSEYTPELAYDIVINTTPNNPQNQLFAKIDKLAPGACVYDMGYTSEKTLFMEQLVKVAPDLKVYNGLGMLIQQAKFGFHHMFGVYPEVEALYPLLTGILHG